MKCKFLIGQLQLTEADQELYKNFPMVVSERWQQEVAETVFEAINADTDKIEQKKKQKPRIDEIEDGVYNVLVVTIFLSYSQYRDQK